MEDRFGRETEQHSGQQPKQQLIEQRLLQQLRQEYFMQVRWIQRQAAECEQAAERRQQQQLEQQLEKQQQQQRWFGNKGVPPTGAGQVDGRW